MEEILRKIATITISLAALVLSVFLFHKDLDRFKSATVTKTEEVKFTQPKLESGRFPWTVRSVDTQVISKHWPNVPKESIKLQVEMIKRLGVNYIAIDTPYDRKEELKNWVDEAHSQGLRVWFRSHWANWEGIEGKPSNLSPDEYLTKTYGFILANRNLFREGDAFTVCVEAEVVGVGLGKRFLTWDEYRNFLIREVNTAADAFSKIGLKDKVHTNWLSVNGWVVMNEFNQELVDNLGLIVVDHYVAQSQTIGDLEDINHVVNQTEKDIDAMYDKWKKPILIGEWGYHISQPVTQERQAEVIQMLFEKLKTKHYLVGVNYWVHMGNDAGIISDNQGADLRYKQSASVLRAFFDPLSPFLTPE